MSNPKSRLLTVKHYMSLLHRPTNDDSDSPLSEYALELHGYKEADCMNV